jgi:hypothetical protein
MRHRQPHLAHAYETDPLCHGVLPRVAASRRASRND